MLNYGNVIYWNSRRWSGTNYTQAFFKAEFSWLRRLLLCELTHDAPLLAVARHHALHRELGHLHLLAEGDGLLAPLQHQLPQRLRDCNTDRCRVSAEFVSYKDYWQEAISMVQVWRSSGYLFSSIMQENVTFSLKQFSYIHSDLSALGIILKLYTLRKGSLISLQGFSTA